jgi:hypothetical protein
MPEISRFLGIVIYMYFNEHNPPHFHAEYNEFKVAISIETLGILEGKTVGSCKLSSKLFWKSTVSLSRSESTSSEIFFPFS